LEACKEVLLEGQDKWALVAYEDAVVNVDRQDVEEGFL
jgi:hypothetical protein